MYTGSCKEEFQNSKPELGLLVIITEKKKKKRQFGL